MLSDKGTLSDTMRDAMTTNAALTRTDAAALELAELADFAADMVAASKASNTKRAYRADFAAFDAWCADSGLEAMPAKAEAVALYAAALVREGLKASSIARAVAAIAYAHKLAGHDSPTKSAAVRETLAGIRRELGVAPSRKAPALADDVRRMVADLPADLLGVRDRAVLLLGFVGAFRRSELAGLEVSDVAFDARGVVVTVRRSKTDQEGEGMVKGIPFAADPALCPVRALRAWLDAAAVTAGPLFRSVDRWGHVAAEPMSDRAVARTVQRAAERVGLDASRFAGHSLRAGFVTSAHLAGKAEADIMRQTGHRSVRVFRGYIRTADAFRANAAAGLL